MNPPPKSPTRMMTGRPCRLVTTTPVQRVGALRVAGRLALLSTLLLGFALVSACKTSEDATAAASQLSKTAKDLSSYYGAIRTALKNTGDLSELQNVLYGTPLDDQQIKEAGEEIEKRARMAKSLEELAEAFSNLTDSKAAEDDADAANKLGQELVSIKALPDGPPIPEARGAAAREAMTLIQEHKEKQAAAVLEQILAGLSDMFAREKPAYESIYKNYVSHAQSIASDMVRKRQVDTSGFLAPALEPFNLTPQIEEGPSTAALDQYALKQIGNQSAALNAAQQKASDAMDEALKEMTKRLHQLATEKTLGVRGAPITLDDVEQWLSKVAASSDED